MVIFPERLSWGHALGVAELFVVLFAAISGIARNSAHAVKAAIENLIFMMILPAFTLRRRLSENHPVGAVSPDEGFTESHHSERGDFVDAAMLIVGLIHMAAPSYGADFLRIMSSSTLAADTAPTFGRVLLGTGHGTPSHG
jgi:hypothetical protein